MADPKRRGTSGGTCWRKVSRCQVEFLLCLLILRLCPGTSQQERSPTVAWNGLSRFVPTNSVYEHRDPSSVTSGSAGDPSLLHLLDENNVPNELKTEKTGPAEGGRGEKAEELETEDVEYVDYEEYEIDEPVRVPVSEKIASQSNHTLPGVSGTGSPRNSSREQKTIEAPARDRNSPEDSSSGKSPSKTFPKEGVPVESSGKLRERPSDGNGKVDNSSVEYDYQDDPPENQYDNYYYYDYDTANNSHYEAIDKEVVTESANEDVVEVASKGQSKPGGIAAEEVEQEKSSRITRGRDQEEEEQEAEEEEEEREEASKENQSLEKNLEKSMEKEAEVEEKREERSGENEGGEEEGGNSEEETSQEEEPRSSQEERGSKPTGSTESNGSIGGTKGKGNLDGGSSMERVDQGPSIHGAASRAMPNGSVLIGEAIVSVVTTKSVVNGSFTIPEGTESPAAVAEHVLPVPISSASSELDEEPPVAPTAAPPTTEDSRILASVQTSRSISGARFLPFPVIDRVRQIERDNAAESKPLESSEDPSAEDNGEPEARKTSPPESTESIIDKLDRVQSDLSSGFLSSGFRTSGNALQLDLVNDRSKKRFTTSSSSAAAAAAATTTGRIPVIGKFVPKRYSNRKSNNTGNLLFPKTESSLDSLEGLLPHDYVINGSKNSVTTERAKIGFKWPSVRSTEQPQTVVTRSPVSTSPQPRNKSGAVVQDISAFLPPGYKLRKEDVAVTEKSVLSDILAKSKVDISALLPPDYNKKKPEASSKAKTDEPPVTAVPATSGTTGAAKTTNVVKSLQDLFAKSEVDISALLPRDYVQKKKFGESTSGAGGTSTIKPAPTSTATPSPTTVGTTTKATGLKIVFPSRPGGRKPIHKITTPPTLRNENPVAVTPRIQKGWPSRATTEFTGWPTPSTTPISIEKLLEAARTATVASTNTSFVPMTSEVSSTSTTTTTTTTIRPTTPGVCVEECEVAGTIRIIGNTTWMPELLDRNTYEWQQLANQLETEMNLVFSKSPILRKWYKNVRIDSFSQGSILVDYFIELSDLRQRVNSQELKVIFHDSLRTYNAEHWNETRIGKGPIRLGDFMIDPKSTDFVVIPKVSTPQYVEKDDRLIPQWAIAVIVIGVGGLLFIIVFGVSVLVNRQSGSKLKPTLSAIYDEDTAKSVMHAINHPAPMHRSSDYPKSVHTIWNDPEVSWNDKSFESTSNKILVDRPLQDNKKYNMYDSWRSEWNGYYYNPSHTSSKFAGYDSTTNLSSRHHPDYDTNF